MTWVACFALIAIGWLLGEFFIWIAEQAVALGLAVWDRLDGAMERLTAEDVCDEEYDEAVSLSYGQEPSQLYVSPLLQDGWEHCETAQTAATNPIYAPLRRTCDRGSPSNAPGIWSCSRVEGHEGPCALHPVTIEMTPDQMYALGSDLLRELAPPATDDA
jgi:hypothetical protein